VTSTIFTTTKGDASFRLINSLANEVLSQESCNALGGHLASYSNVEEQLEVEQVRLPTFQA
jgi:hypothetical protein